MEQNKQGYKIGMADGKVKAEIRHDGYCLELYTMRNGYQWVGIPADEKLLDMVSGVIADHKQQHDPNWLPPTDIHAQPIKVYAEVALERKRQDNKWGGESHDDSHATAEFIQWIEDYAGWARMMHSMNSPEKARRRLVQVAALAIAAIESMDRKSC